MASYIATESSAYTREARGGFTPRRMTSCRAYSFQRRATPPFQKSMLARSASVRESARLAASVTCAVNSAVPWATGGPGRYGEPLVSTHVFQVPAVGSTASGSPKATSATKVTDIVWLATTFTNV